MELDLGRGFLKVLLVDDIKVKVLPAVSLASQHCFLCCQAAETTNSQKTKATGSDPDLFIDAISNACEMSTESILEATEDNAIARSSIIFCKRCQLNLLKFKNIKSQLEILSHELDQLKLLISTTFLAKPSIQETQESTLPNFTSDVPMEFETNTADAEAEHLDLEFHDEGNEFGDVLLMVNLDPLDFEHNSRDPDWIPSTTSAPAVPRTKRKWKRKTVSAPSTSPSDNPSTVRSQRARLRALINRQRESRQTKMASKSARSHLVKKRGGHAFPETSSRTFRCPICPRRNLPNAEFRRFHVRKIHEKHPRPYDCKMCDKEFRTLGELRTHIRNVCSPKTGTPNPLFSGTDAQSNFDAPPPQTEGGSSEECQGKRKGTLIPSTSSRTFRCLICQRRNLPNADLLRFHIRKIHEEHPTPYDCQKCDKEFQSLGELRAHVRKVCSPRPTAEDETSIPSISVTEEQASTKNGSNPPPPGTERVSCKQCREEYKTHLSFLAHLKRQGGTCSREKPVPLPLNSVYDKRQKWGHRFVCGVCGKKYRSRHRLGIHISNSHTTGFSYLCEYCCKPFKIKGGLKAHQRREHLEAFLAAQKDSAVELEKLRSVQCSICNMICSSNGARKAHEARHTKNYNFYCEVCGSGWTNRTELTIHSKSHKGQRKYKCDHCDFTYDGLVKGARHMKAKHNLGDKTKNTKCPFCDKCFWEATHLKRHIKLLHSNPDKKESLEFHCDLCSYDCAIRDYLIIHSKTKKHMQKVEAIGLSDPKTGLRFPPPDPLRITWRRLGKNSLGTQEVG